MEPYGISLIYFSLLTFQLQSSTLTHRSPPFIARLRPGRRTAGWECNLVRTFSSGRLPARRGRHRHGGAAQHPQALKAPQDGDMCVSRPRRALQAATEAARAVCAARRAVTGWRGDSKFRVTAGQSKLRAAHFLLQLKIRPPHDRPLRVTALLTPSPRLAPSLVGHFTCRPLQAACQMATASSNGFSLPS